MHDVLHDDMLYLRVENFLLLLARVYDHVSHYTISFLFTAVYKCKTTVLSVGKGYAIMSTTFSIDGRFLQASLINLYSWSDV